MHVMPRKRTKSLPQTAAPRVERRKTERRQARMDREAVAAHHLSLLEPVYFPFEL